jgi:hypothetical protein
MGLISDLLGTSETEFSIGRGKLLWLPTNDRTIIIPDRSATLATEEQLPHPTPPPVGAYFDNAITAASGTTFTAIANSLRAQYWKIPWKISLDELRWNVTTAAAGSLLRVGLYNCGADYFPTSLIWDSGDLSLAAAGVILRAITPVLNFNPGAFHIAWNFNAATGAVRSLSNNSLLAIPRVDLAMGTGKAIGWAVTQTYGAMPDPFPSPGATLYSPGSAVPQFIWRRSA